MEVAASAISIADICIKYGAILIKTCKAYKHADNEITVAILLIEARWLKIQRQLVLLQKIWPSLEEDYQLHQNSVLHVLHGKVQAAVSLIDSTIGESDQESSVKSLISKKGETKRLKYAIWIKNSLENISKDLKDWSEVFDVSWYLIIRMNDSSLEDELNSTPVTQNEPVTELKELREAINSTLVTQQEAEKSTVFLPYDFFSDFNFTLLESESSSSGVWLDSSGQSMYYLDQATTISTLPDICKLAKILRRADPLKFGILSCNGITKYDLEYGLGLNTRFSFKFPCGFTKPRYLRTLLSSHAPIYTLDNKFVLAKQLAKSVMFVHSAGFVHKSIRPDTILVLEDERTKDLWPFLTGFENFRLAEGITMHQGDDEWDKNLYRHPQRQGINPETTYLMQHDIYSLGVCLLEIGLEESFVIRGALNSKPTPSASISDAINLPLKDRRKKSFQTKRALVDLAEERLPFTMGKTFASIVVTCLTCLDRSNDNFGDESELLDENGILVGVRFIEKVLATLLDLKV